MGQWTCRWSELLILTIGQAPVYSAVIENVDEHKKLLEPIVNDDSYWRQTSEWMSNTWSTMGHEKNTEIPWDGILKDVDSHLYEYLNIFNPRAGFGVQTRPWLNRYEKNGWQEQHNHLGAHAHFSMSYIIDSQDQSNFVFADRPDNWYDYMGISQFFNNWPQRNFIPEQKTGTLLIFPSALDHFVMPNTSEQYRITASANFYITPEPGNE